MKVFVRQYKSIVYDEEKLISKNPPSSDNYCQPVSYLNATHFIPTDKLPYFIFVKGKMGF